MICAIQNVGNFVQQEMGEALAKHLVLYLFALFYLSTVQKKPKSCQINWLSSVCKSCLSPSCPVFQIFITFVVFGEVPFPQGK